MSLEAIAAATSKCKFCGKLPNGIGYCCLESFNEHQRLRREDSIKELRDAGYTVIAPTTPDKLKTIPNLDIKS